MRILVSSLCLLLSVLSGFAAEERSERIAAAETVALRYMTAFFHGDLRSAASLTHPETLRQIKKAFEQERAAATAAGKEAEFLKPFGVKASDDLDALDPVDFYVFVTAGLRSSEPVGVAAMKTTVVSIKGSQRTEGDQAVVSLAILLPADSVVPVQDARLLLAFVDNQWKVVGNAP